MHRYETLIVMLSGMPEAQVRETVDRAKRVIESMGGEVEEIDDWGTRDLAYLIEKHSQGNYVLITYKASAATVTELERTLKLADEVLRFISVRLIPGAARTRGFRRATAPAEGEGVEAQAAEEGN